MEFNSFKAKMNEAGDALVNYISPVSGKQKYHVCTLDLKNCKYIKDKLDQRKFSEPQQGWVRAFCWDLDDFKNIDVASVTSVVPLNKMVSNAVDSYV